MSLETKEGQPLNSSLANGPNALKGNVLGAWISVLSWDEAISTIDQWARRHESRTICICNAHSVVTARTDPSFQRVINDADMATADGAPIAFMLRRGGYVLQERINGPDLMLKYCAHAAEAGQSIFLYGGSPETLVALQSKLASDFPSLRIAGAYSPPYRQLTPEEDAAVVRTINESKAHVVWVGLGCPKQERWMDAHKGLVNAVMIGVGAAFDYHAGKIRRAPLWMQHHGLEWLHRLCSEPGRLWRRYLVTNTLFVRYAASQLIGRQKRRER